MAGKGPSILAFFLVVPKLGQRGDAGQTLEVQGVAPKQNLGTC